MSQYSFSHQWDGEHARLRHLEALLDPGTVRSLEAIGVAPGWRCLEVGAGAGSIAVWLCESVGAQGSVTATDLETSFLEQLRFPNLTVLEHDVVREDLPVAEFDLVHARAVLEHLPERDDVLAKLIRAVKPGGWILVEDPDHYLTVHTHEPEAPFREAMKLVLTTLSSEGGQDAFFGRRLHSALSGHGLTEVTSEGRVYQQSGGTLGAPGVWQLVFERLREPLMSAAGLSTEQFEEMLLAFDNPKYGVMSPIYWAARGRRN